MAGIGNASWRGTTYNEQNRLMTATDALDNQYQYFYKPNGLLDYSIDPNRTRSECEYTANNQLMQINMSNAIKGESREIEYNYDEGGHLKWKRDGAIYQYYNYNDDAVPAYMPDNYSRVKKETKTIDGKSFTMKYGYDSMNRLNSITYPNEKTVNYTYNSLGELEGVEGYTSGLIKYDGGLMSEITAANGVKTTMSYDDNSRLIGLSYNKTGYFNKSYTFGYDAANNISRRNGDRFYYDKENRLYRAELEGTYLVNAENQTQDVGAVREDYFGQKNLDFNLEFVVQDVEMVELDYAAGSIGVDLKKKVPVTKIILTPDTGSQTRVSIQDLRIFTSLTNDPDDYTEQFNFTATPHDMGEGYFIEIKFTVPVQAQYVKVKTDYDERNAAFDFVNNTEFKNNPEKLIKVFYTEALRTEEFQFDKLGNRNFTNIDTEGIESGSRYYPLSNRLMTDGKWAYQYDANGNRLKKGDTIMVAEEPKNVKDVTSDEWNGFIDSTSSIVFASGNNTLIFEYTFDILNRMTEVKKNGSLIASYVYDVSGLLLKKTKGTEITYYMTASNGRRLYEENADSKQYKQYVYVGNSLFAYEKGVNSSSNDPIRRYIHTDQIKSVVAITDENGNKVWENNYTPYGALENPDEEYEDFSVYGGHFIDRDTDLFYMVARWYDKDTGRFLSEDPFKDTLNWYSYCYNNPISYTDPLGLTTDANKENKYGSGWGYHMQVNDSISYTQQNTWAKVGKTSKEQNAGQGYHYAFGDLTTTTTINDNGYTQQKTMISNSGKYGGDTYTGSESKYKWAPVDYVDSGKRPFLQTNNGSRQQNGQSDEYTEEAQRLLVNLQLVMNYENYQPGYNGNTWCIVADLDVLSPEGDWFYQIYYPSDNPNIVTDYNYDITPLMRQDNGDVERIMTTQATEAYDRAIRAALNGEIDRISAEEGQEFANQGIPIIGITPENHTVIIAPDINYDPNEGLPHGPRVGNVGGDPPGNGFMYLDRLDRDWENNYVFFRLNELQ